MVDVISISWGLDRDVPSVATALTMAQNKNVIILASASNVGLNRPVTFPARHPNVFCVGSADATGTRSNFSPVARDMEKFSAVGEAVLGATVPWRNNASLVRRKDGTSTATAVATGIAALLLLYTRLFLEPENDASKYANMRKLFLFISQDSKGEPYRFLAPWSLFEVDHSELERRNNIKGIISGPPRICLQIPG